MRTLLLLPVVAALLTVFGPTQPDAAAPPLPIHSGRYPDGRALEVVGDPSAARTVVVLVPGVNSTAANFDRGLGGVQRRAPAWQAHRLADEIAARGGPGAADRVAVVAWLGYRTPEGVGLDAAREDLAAAGAAALREFVARLPGERIVVVGHSYGSTVAGLAAPGLDRRVSDIVALGSPGMGVDSAGELRTAAHVWAGSAADDWIRRIPGVRVLGAGHGAHPYDPSFGAEPLPVGGVVGHDGYFVPGTESLRALADIALGAVPAGAL
ncbi:alpha/beta fold hydrolase [Dactylosporangium sp. NPDC000555]|uniref:alpha/beta fold hydrolase n=1 Tax=Dactylosporangium sp. NPDC000555 TaxID=3154260 RepID=UPI00331C311D